MSDNLRRYRAIRAALMQGYPCQPTGTRARPVTTLAAVLSGIVGSQRTQLPPIAAHVPDGTQPESRGKRFARWLKNAQMTEEVYFVPFAEVLLAPLAVQTLVLVMDGSVVGRGGVALMLPVVSKGRALPLAWQVRQGATGHFPEDLQIALSKQGHRLLPSGASVVVLGDGACDGTCLQHTMQAYHWSYVVRTGSNITVLWEGNRFRCETVGACITPGTLGALRDARVTAAASGPMLLLGCWAKGYKDPLYVLTHLPSPDEACGLYAKRFRIATFFADQNSRGFHVHQSPLSAPTRLSRLLIAAC